LVELSLLVGYFLLKYHVARYGSPDLPVILFLHGFMGSSQDFEPLLPELAEHFHCICVDLPGHGQTVTENYDIPCTAKSLVALLESLLIDQPCGLVGYSWGGRLALYLALHYPHYWHQVVLESASAGLANLTDRQARQKQDQAIARKLCQPDLDFTEFISQWYRQPVFQGISDRPDFPALIHQRLQNNPLALARSIEAAGLGSQPYLGNLLAANQIPLLLLVGEDDHKFIEINQNMAASCSAAELLMVSDCSHNIHWQQPQRWIQAIQSWFS
jgi:2-succinyl-6-hydroxy-2,4-cyclohexadiene-1-carboxylate synthase